MKHIKKTGLMLMAVIAILLTVAAAHAAPLAVDINHVELEDTELVENHVNRLDVLNDQKVTIMVALTALEDLEDVEVEVFVSGFEYNDVYSLSDSTSVFDMDAGVKYVKKLSINFPDLVEEDDYKLRLIISDRNSDEVVKNYNLKLDVPRHRLVVEDVVFFPGSDVTAGQALLTTIRLENKGEKDEEDVRVNVIVPELGIGASDYINEIRSSKEEETEEIFLRIPSCASAGTYPLLLEAVYNQGFDKVQAQTQLTVLKNPRCEEDKEEENAAANVALEPVAPAEPKLVEQESESAGKSYNYGSIRKGLEIAFLALVVLLFLVGLIVAFSKRKEEDLF